MAKKILIKTQHHVAQDISGNEFFFDKKPGGTDIGCGICRKEIFAGEMIWHNDLYNSSYCSDCVNIYPIKAAFKALIWYKNPDPEVIAPLIYEADAKRIESESTITQASWDNLIEDRKRSYYETAERFCKLLPFN